MSRKKKTENIGTISGMSLLRSTRPRQDIPFRTGWSKTEKDRPRKKIKAREVEEYV